MQKLVKKRPRLLQIYFYNVSSDMSLSKEEQKRRNKTMVELNTNIYKTLLKNCK